MISKKNYLLQLTFFMLLLSSCSTNHVLHLSFLPEIYTYELPDGTIIHSWYSQNDSSKKRNKTSLREGQFDGNDINKLYQNLDSAMIQELTVQNLKEDFTDFDYTLISLYYGCPVTKKYELWQYKLLVDTLAQVMENPHKIAFAFISSSCDFYRINYILRSYDYHYQSYLIPTEKYGDKIDLKLLKFITELCPKCYEENKYYARENTMFLLDRNRQIVKIIDYQFDENEKKEIKDFEKVRDELIELVKQ